MKIASSAKERVRQFVRRELRPLATLIIGLLAVRSAIADWNDVPTGSMKPTILEGDRVFVNKLAYDLKVPFTTWHLAQWDNPARGDVVVFFSPADGQRLVKRVVGMPGDQIELVNNTLLVNGAAAAYGPLPDAVPEQLPAAERFAHQYAAEDLGRHHHPVMTTPALNAKRTFGPVQVPVGSYFMMGDNRDNSFDSRYFGCVERGRITGRAVAVALSVDRGNYFLPRWKRFLTAIP